MTDKIIEMLGSCKDCERCENVSFEDVIRLINSQRTEIERLEGMIRGYDVALKSDAEHYRAEIERLQTEKDNLIKTYKECMTEAIKEFAERLKKELSFGRYIQLDQIDNLVKEMVGERNE